MRYWYDTEFVEDGRTIDLLSMGMVAEDGREFYLETPRAAFYREYPSRCPNLWVVKNVLPHLTGEYGNVMAFQEALKRFCNPKEFGKPEFWGYYSAYDHVALCWIFGEMIKLPEGWPMYTRDIKQWCDELGNPPLPRQKGTEHNALTDARWTKEAWEFLNERSK